MVVVSVVQLEIIIPMQIDAKSSSLSYTIYFESFRIHACICHRPGGCF